jgi:glycosyltransferase involved in cell wall biosynthesis
MRIAIVTDAWQPQVNGVVTTLTHTQRTLAAWGHDVTVLSPVGHRTLPCPTYPEIRLAVLPNRKLQRALVGAAADAVHIATEGPLGMAARRLCRRLGLAFTTSYHTQFPQYVAKRLPIPESWSYAFLRGHHNAARRTMVATESQRQELLQNGFRDVVIWPRGVDASRFRPRGRDHLAVDRPIWMYVGRLAVEKNLEAYLELDLPGTKVLVGDGPDQRGLSRRFPAARFVGYKFGDELAELLSSADVFVFPSRTDTFGLVMLEAMACGTPVAAFPVTGPVDVVDHGVTGVLSESLQEAALGALRLDREDCRAAVAQRTWSAATSRFLEHLVAAQSGKDLVAPVDARTRAACKRAACDISH